MMSDQDMNAAVEEMNYFGNGRRDTQLNFGIEYLQSVVIFSVISECKLNYFVCIAYWKLTLPCMFI